MRVKAITRKFGCSIAALGRRFFARFARGHYRQTARSLGFGRSGRGDLSERVEELLIGLPRGR
jgi:hypothetical protein